MIAGKGSSQSPFHIFTFPNWVLNVYAKSCGMWVDWAANAAGVNVLGGAHECGHLSATH